MRIPFRPRSAVLVPVALAVWAAATTSGCGSGSSGGAAETAAGSALPLPTPEAAEQATAATQAAGEAGPRATEPGAVRAGELVTHYYSSYLAAPGRQTAATFVTADLLDTLFAPHRDVDRVLCSHAVPESAGAVPVAATAKAVTVRVTTVLQGVPRPPITVTLRMRDLKITKITCPR